MAVGYFVVMVSPAMGVTSAGMLLGSVGQEGIFVVSVGMLSAGLADPKARASGFAMLAMATRWCTSSLRSPPGHLVGLTGWRVVIGLWVLGGLAAALPGQATIATRRRQRHASRAVDPGARRLRAGLPGPDGQQHQPGGLGCDANDRVGGAATVATVGLVVLMRRLPEPSLDISVPRHGGFRLLLVVILLVPFASMAFYATVGAQFVYGYGVFATSLIMIPVQVTSLAGAWLSGRMIRRSGIRATGTIALVLTSVALFLAATQRVSTPVVVSLLIVCLYSGALTAANAPMTNAIMNPPPRARKAARRRSEGLGQPRQRHRGGHHVGDRLLDVPVLTDGEHPGFRRGRVAGGIDHHVPARRRIQRTGRVAVLGAYDRVVAADDDQQSAMVQAYQVQGIVGGAVVLVAALIFGLYRGPSAPKRSHRHRRRVTAEPEVVPALPRLR